jgi:hypothetical protein
VYKTKQIKSISGSLLRILAFAAVLFVFYFQMQNKKFSWNEMPPINYVPLTFLFLFMPLNWWLEWKKFKIMVSSMKDENDSNNKSAFYAGMLTGFLTPAMVGNFIGRNMYYPKSDRWRLTVYTMMGNYAQFVISMTIGGVGLLYLHFYHHQHYLSSWQLVLTVILIIIPLALFIFCRPLLQLLPIQRAQTAALALQNGPSMNSIFGFSAVRYLVFLLQFALALYAFSGQFSLIIFVWISVVFLLVTLAPSLFLGKIIIRESIAVAVLTLVGFESTPVLFASLSTWVINLILPNLWAAFQLKMKSK